MQNNNTAGLQISGTTTRLEQALSHLRIEPTTEHNPTCQLCEEPLTEGEQVTLYLYKPAGRFGYAVGQCRCRSHDDDLTPLFTLGMLEVIVEGRIGQCQDHATQQTWSVLLEPSIQLISAADTTMGRAPTDSDTTDVPPWFHGERLRDRAADGQKDTHTPTTSQTEIRVGGVQ